VAVVNEPVEALRYVFALLNGLTAAAVYDGQAPESTPAAPVTYPLIVMQALPSVDTIVIGGVRVWAIVPVMVHVAAEEPSFLTIDPIAIAVDTALHRTSGATATARISSCVRQNAWTLYPVKNGIVYRELVSRYLICVQPL
jgi:hypothetical protein